MIEWVIGGLILGTITGLMPGIHPNLIAVVLAGIFTDSTILIFTTAVTHTFLNSIPTTYLSIPDAETALSLHPSQEYAKKGRAHEAVILTIIGSFSETACDSPMYCVDKLMLELVDAKDTLLLIYTSCSSPARKTHS